MDAVNGSTLWTWNAIGKRAGAWALDKDAPEATRGFLLNHLIDELLPPKGDGRRWANSDPITGQAAWFDLAGVDPQGSRPGQRAKPARCRRAKQPGRTGAGQCGIRTGESPMTSLPQGTEKRLGLVIDLDTCVGCHACAVNCKEWNTGAGASPLADVDAYGADAVRCLAQPDPHLRGDARDAPAQIVHFPKSCLHCDDAPCVTVCPTGASHKRAEDGIVLVTEDLCIGCGCAPGPAPTARARWTRSKT
jgi:ferredoxin-like protein FixX